jgi:hypothetical protein
MSDNRFTKIPKKMNDDSRLRAMDFAVYSALDYFADDNGFAWPGLSKIAEKSHLSRTAVKESLRRLLECGYIRKEQRRKIERLEFDSSLFTLVFRAEAVRETDGGMSCSDIGRSPKNIGGRSPHDRGVGRHTTRNETNIHETNKTTPLPPTGGSHPPAGEFSKKLSPSEGSFSETTPLTSAETKAKDNPPKTKDKGARGGESAQKAHYDKVDANFLDFWENYPRKEGEAEARRKWRKLFPFGRDGSEYRGTLDRVSERLGAVLTRIDEGGLEPRFVPKAQNWLKDEDWSHD